MISHYLLWATGEDKAGIVAALAKILYDQKCNLEDSSMAQLGGEFGVLLIFSCPRKLDQNALTQACRSVEKRMGLTIGLKSITARQARAPRPRRESLTVSVHGADRRGLVFGITKALAAHSFNITNLWTHRTSQTKTPGYILFIEGYLKIPSRLSALKKNLNVLKKQLKTTIRLHQEDATLV